MDQVWAHSANVEGDRHGLRDHLLGTASLARVFGEVFGAGDAAELAGLLHDAGKMSPAWQDYLRRSEAGLRPAKVDHKTAGAALAKIRLSDLGASAICGHHHRLPDVSKSSIPSAVDLGQQRDFFDLVPEAETRLRAGDCMPAAWRAAARDDRGIVEFGTRMLHSTLVDADFLDTAAHFNATEVERGPVVNFSELVVMFEAERTALLKGRVASPADTARERVYQECLRAAQAPQGVFRLPAPTGSGKTLAAAGFAIHHAARHGMRRVVVAVPFLTITEQNAAVYRRLLGEDLVLEHHSAIEPEARSRYGVENWDSPFVVTTTVQLFNSLFSGRPSASRKLHRLSGAVLVLDEIQALPQHVLPTVLDGLRLLVQYFGTTVLFASATQPDFEALRVFKDRGVEPVDVIADPAQLYAGMRRVTTRWCEVGDLDGVVREVSRHRQALVVVNTTADSRDLARRLVDEVPHPVLHLSTRMIPAHRRQVLTRVRHILAAGDPVTLVSTQLIEAGVDVDFPTVFRAMAPADSLLQAAGRANREGRLPRGNLVVLTGPGVASLGAYRTGVGITTQIFRDGGAQLDDPEAMRCYYRSLYASLALEDQRAQREMDDLRKRCQFASVGEKFTMIDQDTVQVLVPIAESAGLLHGIEDSCHKNGVPTRAQLRALQPYTLSLAAQLASQPAVAAYIVEAVAGLRTWAGPYDPLVGIDLSAGPHDSIW